MEIILYLLGIIQLLVGGIISYMVVRINNNENELNHNKEVITEEMAQLREDVNNAMSSLTQYVNKMILEATKEQSQIKTNYLDRFKEVTTLINEGNTEIKATLSELKTDVALLNASLKNGMN